MGKRGERGGRDGAMGEAASKRRFVPRMICENAVCCF